MKKTFAATAIAFGLAAQAAQAAGPQPPLQEPPVVTPIAPIASSYDWTGPYAGLSFGFGQASTNNPAAPDRDGVGGAVHFGYNMDFGGWVAGAEIELAPTPLLREDDDGEIELRQAGRFKLRAGPKIGADGRTFAYGSLGAVHVRTRDTTTGDSFSDTGWMAGVGVAHAFTDNWFATGEITHQRLNNVVGTETDARATIASVGISFRF